MIQSHAAGKRTLDVALGLLLAFVSLPVIALTAALLGATLRAWPFFVQERLGKGGRPLLLPKLRTLPPGTARWLLKPDVDEIELNPVCRFVRRRHLDELPQLLLVLLGRLSLVGPRPKMPDHVEPVDPEYGRRRIQVPQGCTGLWQIGGDTDRRPSDAPEYDLFYLDHRCLRLDGWILWRTMLLMSGLGPPVALDDVPRWALGRARR